MKTKILLSIFILISTHSVAQHSIKIKNKSPLTIGEQIEIESKILNEERTLNIYLPHGYIQDSLKTYPVIYLLDGSIDEDFIHIAGIVQFGSFSWINMLPESIVVGISNVDRKKDFTFPTQNNEDKLEFPTTGESAKFIQFIEKELQPLINSEYKTDSVNTLIGQSLGGLLATEILFKSPELFDNYIIVSPSLWWDDESLLKFTPTNYSSEKSVYIAVGKEGELMERIARELYEKLNQLNNKHTSLYFEFLNEQDHADALHLAAYRAFERIFRDFE